MAVLGYYSGMTFVEIILLSAVLALIACGWAVYHFGKIADKPEPEKATFKTAKGEYAGYARIFSQHNYLKIKLYNLERLGLAKGAVMDVEINGLPCYGLIMEGAVLENRTACRDFKNDPGLCPGSKIEIKSESNVLLTGFFGV